MKNKIPVILLVLFSLFFIFLFYGKVIIHPDNYLFNNNGDAVKNYFTYSYHIKHDTSYINFEGMNYPYGEHFIYTDCHPTLANLFKLFSSKFPFIGTHSIGILNFLMILSVFSTFFVSYFLLKTFNINVWFCLLYSIGITILAPQLFRLDGHFALSYSIAIPLSWLLLIKSFKNSNKIIYILLLFLTTTFWMFIHAYLGIIILFFLICLVVTNYLLNKNRGKEIKHYVLLLFTLLLPILLFYSFTVLTDTHTDRTKNPSGFFQYNAEPDDIFLPHHAPIKPILDKLTGNIIVQEWEAWSYVGFSTTLIFLILIILAFIELFKKNKSTILANFFDSKILNNSLIAALVVLLFAMAFPFKQITGLVDLVPIVKQFRATGRFAWPFYFVATVFSAKVLNDFFTRTNSLKKNVFVITICIAAGSLNIIEGLSYHIETSKAITQSKNIFDIHLLSAPFTNAIQHIHPNDYQAIIALPFYYQGSETYVRPRNNETMRASMCISYHTGLPIVCANLTRTSIWESKNIIQLVSPDFYKKEILNDLPSNKPFLIIRTTDSITHYENNILSKSKLIYQSNEISLYTIKKEELFKNSAQELFNKYKKIKPDLYPKNGFELTKDSAFLYYNDFGSLKSDKPFRGKGGFQSVKKGKNTFAEFTSNTFVSGKKYEVSIWMYNGIPDALNNWLRFTIEECDGEKITCESTTYFPAASEVINGNWSLIEGVFEVKNAKNKISIGTIGKDDSKQLLFADDLLIKELGVDVYSLNKSGDILFYNNHEITLPK